MSDLHKVPSQEKNRWWQDRAIVVGIIGVVATVVVGVVTYWLTAGTVSREYAERVRAARNEVLIAVGRSIGEGVVPGKGKIQAVISSVERQYGVKEQDSEKPEAIIEDIVERVLANEFLDAKRREDISTKLLAVKNEKLSLPPEAQSKQLPEERRSAPLQLAMVSAAFTGFVSAIVGFYLLIARNEYKSLYLRMLAPMLILLLFVFVASLILSTTPAGKELIKRLQTH
jgi:uncharacterized membrane-anchored protein